MRKVSFAVGEFYHVYNRGVDKRDVFSNEYDLMRFFQSMTEFNSEELTGSIYEKSFSKDKELGSSAPKSRNLVDFVCYCLNPNHYHFLLQESIEKGVEKFMHRLGTGYTNYFNGKEKRTGSLFQGRFKAIHVNSNEYLLHLSAYINLNYRVHQLGSSAPKLSSWEEYVEENDSNFCKKNVIMGQFRNKSHYKEFAENSLNDILKRKGIAKELDLMFLE